jgi:hypothetical protein
MQGRAAMASMLVASMLVILVTALASAAEPKEVPLAEAARHVGEEVIVEFEVQSSRLLDTGKFCFLNSERDFREKANFTIAISAAGLEKFAAAKIDDPAEHFAKKTIRVRGKVSLHQERPQIVVDDPRQISVVIRLKAE